MREKRNEPCACGSGKKYKVCCANKRTPSQWLALASVGVFAVLAVWVVAGLDTGDPDDQVWSAEHGHYHPAPGTTGSERPPGPAPPGKEWSNGGWQDLAVPGLGRPPGPAPAGKAWNEEHGHWHDADGAEPAGEFQIPLDQPQESWTELPQEDASYDEEEAP